MHSHACTDSGGRYGRSATAIVVYFTYWEQRPLPIWLPIAGGATYPTASASTTELGTPSRADPVSPPQASWARENLSWCCPLSWK